MSGPFSRRSVRGLDARAASRTYVKKSVVLPWSFFFAFVWLGLGASGVAREGPFVWFAALQLLAVLMSVRHERVERDGDKMVVRRSVLGVLPLPRVAVDTLAAAAGVPLDVEHRKSARASVTVTSEDSYNREEGGKLVPVTEIETTTFDCDFDSTTCRHTGSKPVPFAQGTPLGFTKPPVRITAIAPWPCFEVEYRDFNRGGRPTTCRFEPASGEDPSKFDLVVEALLRSAEEASRRKKKGERVRRGYTDVDVVVERGWAAIPHALWIPAEGFPETAATGGPFRQRVGDDSERWAWTATDEERASLGRVGTFESTHETAPERVVVHEGRLYAHEPGSGLIGWLPLDTLCEATPAGDHAWRFRFGRATDVVVPKDSEAARRLRERLEVQEARIEEEIEEEIEEVASGSGSAHAKKA